MRDFLPTLPVLLRKWLPGCPDEVVELMRELLNPDSVNLTWTHQLWKPYGTNRIFVYSSAFGLSLAELFPGACTSLHYHRVRKEFFWVGTGLLEFTSGDSVRLLAPGECAGSIPLKPHQLRNPGSERLKVVEVFSPGLVDDKVRITDFYKRKLGPVIASE